MHLKIVCSLQKELISTLFIQGKFLSISWHVLHLELCNFFSNFSNIKLGLTILVVPQIPDNLIFKTYLNPGLTID